MSLLLRSRLTLAAKMDRLESILRRVGERIGWPQAWLQEYISYLGEPRMSLEEFWVRYTLKRMAAEPKFAAVKTEADALAFYRDEDYMLWRNLVHRRHAAWRRVLVTMRGRTGCLLEFGCGIAPVMAWVQPRKPQWYYWLEDIRGPAMKFARWRRRRETPWAGLHHVITALDVFEHLADPEKHARGLVDRLAPRGYLHSNYICNDRRNDLDLSTLEQRDATLAYLDSALDLVWSKDGYTVRQKA